MSPSDSKTNPPSSDLQSENSQQVPGFETGRVIAEHKGRYIVKTDKGETEAEITGKLRFSAAGREDFPAVGDYVALSIYEPDFSVIHQILPRSSVIQRQAVGQAGEIQIIATNVDYAFLVQAVNRDYNINRLERYLTLCNTSAVKPIIVLTKTDLVSADELSVVIQSIQQRIPEVPLIAISNETREGYEALASLMEPGKTYCMLGSSGAGKSTLLNNLLGKEVMKTGAISTTSDRGRHITSHRELHMLDNGAFLIDNPGMREVGIADTAQGLEMTFDRIIGLSKNCRFSDCSHTFETGCAVIESVKKGETDAKSYENYLKMEREKAHFESSQAERRKKDKEFGKMIRNYEKVRRKNDD